MHSSVASVRKNGSYIRTILEKPYSISDSSVHF